MRVAPFLVTLGLLAASRSGFAQRTLYLDLRAGINHNFVEGAYLGKGEPPFKAHGRLNFGVQAVAMLRLQLSEQVGIATGYSGSELGWAYGLKVPKQHTRNPFEGEEKSHGSGLYLHQFPLLLTKTMKVYHLREIDTVRHTYLASFRLDAVFGGGLNRLGNYCRDCDEELSTGGGLYDEIEFRETLLVRRQWGQFLLGGVTARFYRLGKERLNLSLYYTQGLTDMLLVPVEYRYNTQRGATTLHVRGSGFSATLGVPLRLATFGIDKGLLKSKK